MMVFPYDPMGRYSTGDNCHWKYPLHQQITVHHFQHIGARNIVSNSILEKDQVIFRNCARKLSSQTISLFLSGLGHMENIEQHAAKIEKVQYNRFEKVDQKRNLGFFLRKTPSLWKPPREHVLCRKIKMYVQIFLKINTN